MEKRDWQTLRGQCLNASIQILTNSKDPPNLRGQKDLHPEIFALARSLMQAALDAKFLEWSEKDFGIKPAEGGKCTGCGTTITPRVLEYSTEKHGKALCMDCQKKE